MTRTGDREIRSVSGRLPDNPGELACMSMMSHALGFFQFSYLTFYITEMCFILILNTKGNTQRNFIELAFQVTLW